MSKKDKKKGTEKTVTVRIDFEGEALERFTNFRFTERYDSWKDAAVFLIEKGIDDWMKDNRDQTPANDGLPLIESGKRKSGDK